MYYKGTEQLQDRTVTNKISLINVKESDKIKNMRGLDSYVVRGEAKNGTISRRNFNKSKKGGCI